MKKGELYVQINTTFTTTPPSSLPPTHTLPHFSQPQVPSQKNSPKTSTTVTTYVRAIRQFEVLLAWCLWFKLIRYENWSKENSLITHVSNAYNSYIYIYFISQLFHLQQIILIIDETKEKFVFGDVDDSDENRETGKAEQETQITSGGCHETRDVVNEGFHFLLNIERAKKQI